MSDDKIKDVEVRVVQKAVEVIADCPYCDEEIKQSYSDFCDEFGEPPDWNYNKIKCPKCEKEFKIMGSDWG